MKEDDMATVDVNRRFVWGGVAMLGVGGLLCAAGATLCTAAVIGATRRWVGQLEEPPSQVARRRWAQARAATSAGVGAWRQDTAQTTPNQSTGGRTMSVNG
jgi:hypothetical protein